jgi:acyl-CoA synthetase (AMP-forming)/AMP-acid ligase II
MAWNIADLTEHIVDSVPDRIALIIADEPRTYAQLEERANRLAHHLAAQGIGPGDHVGIYGFNSHAFVETIFAAYKLRAVPINVNYRYVEAELRYLFDNADLVALVHDAQFAPRIAAVRDALEAVLGDADRDFLQQLHHVHANRGRCLAIKVQGLFADLDYPV